MANQNPLAGQDNVDPALEEVVVQASRTTEYYDPFYMMGQSFLKSSRFMMRIPVVPDFAMQKSRISEREFSFLCDSVEFPGQSLTTSDYRIPGQLKRKIPYLRDLNEVNMTFYYNVKFPIYRIFADWIEGISYSATENRYFDDITCGIELIQFKEGTNFLDRVDNILGLKKSGDAFQFNASITKHMTTKLINAYPLNFASLPSNWSDDGFHKMSVSFFYEDITISSEGYSDEADYMNNSEQGIDDYNNLFKNNTFG